LSHSSALAPPRALKTVALGAFRRNAGDDVNAHRQFADLGTGYGLVFLDQRLAVGGDVDVRRAVVTGDRANGPKTGLALGVSECVNILRPLIQTVRRHTDSVSDFL